MSAAEIDIRYMRGGRIPNCCESWSCEVSPVNEGPFWTCHIVLTRRSYSERGMVTVSAFDGVLL